MNKIVDVLKKKDDLFVLGAQKQEAIDGAQRQLGISFSEEYKEYLLAFGLVTYDSHELSGICPGERLDVVEMTTSERGYAYNENIPPDAYVIEQLNIAGIVIWQTQSGEIFQSAPNTEFTKIYDSLAAYIQSE